MDKGKGQRADRPREPERKLGLGAVVSLRVGTVIGSGISSSVGGVTAASGCAATTILAFIVGGIIMIPQNMMATGITAACPDDGGFCVWFRGTGSRSLTFLCSWTTLWDGDPSSYSVTALTLADYIAFFIPGIAEVGIKLLATALIVAFTIINMRSVEVGGRFLTFMTNFKVLLFALLIDVELFYADKTMISTPTMTGASIGFKALLAGVSATTWSYVGMATACSVAGEVKDPEETIPRALITAVFVTIAIYTSLAATVTGLLSMNLLTASSAPVAEAAARIPVIGSVAGVMTAFIAVIVIIASLHGTIMCQPGVEYATTKDGLFFRKFVEIRPKWETPASSTMYSCTVSIVLVFAADIGTLLGFLSFVTLCKNALSFAAVSELHKRADYSPSWKYPAWLLMTILFMGANVVLLVSTFLWAPYKGLFSAFVVVVTGLPAYYLWESKNGKEGRA